MLSKQTAHNYAPKIYARGGVPALYQLTRQGKQLIGHSPTVDKIKVEQITHDIAVVDSVLHFCTRRSVPFSAITTEKELHQIDGFGTRQHRPDFTFILGEKTTCVEVELTPKAKDRLTKIVADNFLNYDE